MLRMLTTNGQFFGQSALLPRAAAATSGINFNNPKSEQSFHLVSLCPSHLVNMSLSKSFCHSHKKNFASSKNSMHNDQKRVIMNYILF